GRRRSTHRPARRRARGTRGPHPRPHRPRRAAALPARGDRVPRRARRHDAARRGVLPELGLPDDVPLAPAARDLGDPVRAHRDALPHGPHRGLHRPDRGGQRDLPRGVRGQHALVEPPHRGEHPEPGLGPVGRLRHPRPGLHRPRPDRRLRARGGAADAPGRRPDPRAARPARGDHRLARGDPRGAAVHPRGVAGARGDPVADDLEADPPGRPARGGHGRHPRPVAGDRRDGAAHPGRRGGVPALQSGAGRAVLGPSHPDPERGRRARGDLQEHRGRHDPRPSCHPAPHELGGHLPAQPLRDQVV
ncbi:MAG: Phosphate transport system permease protein PstA, partial [uncultured Solirubrobacteraceae bacterium]